MRSALLAALAAFALVAACGGEMSGPDDENPAVKPREAARVRTAPVERREMVRTISTTALVESEHEIAVIPRGTGIVEQLLVEEGDRVEAGAVLAVLDRRATQSAVEEARIAVREAEDSARKAAFALPEARNKLATSKLRMEQTAREFERNQQAGMISAQQLDNLRVARDMAASEHETALLAVQRAEVEIAALGTQREKAENALQRAQLNDDYMTIRAPIAGVVASRGLRVGDTASQRSIANPETMAFVLTDPTALRTVVYRPQRELGLFLAAHQGAGEGALEIRVTAEALPGRTFPGQILLVSPSVDPQSGSFRVTVRLPGNVPGASEAGLVPGMLVRLEIVTERHADALVVPKRALRREGGGAFVIAVRDGRARRAEVDEGFSDDESVEVRPLAGIELAAGERVVVVGNRELEDGDEIVEEAAAPEAEEQPPEPAAGAGEAPPQRS